MHTWTRKWEPTPVFLPGDSHGQRSLAGYSPWDRKSPHKGPLHLELPRGEQEGLTRAVSPKKSESKKKHCP